MNNDLKVPKEAMEFQSDAIELEHKKLPFSARIVLYSILLFLACGITWACLCKVDKIVVAEGKLITARQNITMKPLERTVIKSINVEVGQTVKKGQILITFDPTFNAAEEERLQEQYGSLNAQMERLTAEATGKNEVNFTTGDKKDRNLQGSIFAKRKLFYNEKLKFYQENINRLKAAVNTRKQTVKKQRERLKALMKIENMLTGLHAKKSVSLKQLLETQISRLQMEGEVDQLENQILELNHEKLSVESERSSFVKDWQRNIAEELVKVERELNDVDKQLDKAKRLTSLVNLRSPCEAVVHEIASFPEGSGVREAEPLITLVPIGISVEAQVNINPKDIGLVKVDDEARLKLDAFPFQKYGTLEGKVKFISQDTFQNEEKDMFGARPNTFYHARIIVSGRLDYVPKNFKLVPGMKLSAEIKVGRRRIIEYLIHPLIKAFDESMREP